MPVNVMIVDSDSKKLFPSVRSSVSNKDNMSVIMFSDPLKAVSYAKYNHIDVLFTSINMMGLGGFSLAGKMKWYNPDIHIVFMSNTDEYALEAVYYHPDRFLVSPVSGVEIYDIAREYSNILMEEA